MKSKHFQYSFIAISILIALWVVGSVFIFPNKSPVNNPGSFWKPSGGKAVFGDVVQFSNDANDFRNDTLFKGRIPIAIVLEMENRFFSGDRVMTVKNIKTGEIGTYCEK
ncbi:MAG TPA: hypothetical protein VF677_08560 [Flavobacterium sp.]|jgi:hypothetical protein